MTIDEMIAVLQAAKEGKVIQARVGSASWIEPAQPCSSFNFAACDYRVKPEPLEGWFNEYYRDCPTTVTLYPTKEAADKSRGPNCLRCVHVREVID